MNAQLLGMIIVSKIYNSAMARASMDAEDRKDFYLYVDEFQNFVSGTFADILSEARKYRLGLIMAHQYIAQLDPPKWLWDSGWGKSDVKAAVFGNVWTMMSFKVGAPDAEFLEKEYTPVLWPADIVGIANYKSYIKLNIDNSTTRVFSMNSIYTQDYQNKKIVPILKEYSAKKYGRRREFVDAEVKARLGISIDEEELPMAVSENNEEAGNNEEWIVNSEEETGENTAMEVSQEDETMTEENNAEWGMENESEENNANEEETGKEEVETDEASENEENNTNEGDGEEWNDDEEMESEEWNEEEEEEVAGNEEVNEEDDNIEQAQENVVN